MRAAIVALALTAVSAAAAPAAAADPSCAGGCLVVTVTGDVSLTRTVSADDLAGQLVPTAAPYRLRLTPGGSSEPLDIGSAVSVRTVLEYAGLAPDLATYAVVRADPDRYSTLDASTGDLADDTDTPFADGLLPAFFVNGRGDASGGASIGFIRPLRADGSQDVNRRDYWAAPNSGVVHLDVSTRGTLLTPTLTACDSPAAGTACRFAVSLDPARTDVTYRWRFNGFSSSSEPGTDRVSHTYGQDGSYRVVVEASAPDGSYGITSLVVTVGPSPSPQPSGHETGGGPDPSSSAPAEGPTRRPSKSPGLSGSPTASPTRGGASESGGTSPTPGSSRTHPTTPPGDRTPTPSPSTTAPPADPRPVVEGVVIAGPAGPAPVAAPRTAEDEAAAARAQAPSSVPLAPYAGALAVAALLGVGAAGEAGLLRRARGRRLRR